MPGLLPAQIPVLVTGHTHRLTLEKINRSLCFNPGTTGAAGARGPGL
ncbi:MAG: hypothetical protein ACUVSK_14085 [Desulfotomaculales bacterium]